jgi:superoxide dismutase
LAHRRKRCRPYRTLTTRSIGFHYGKHHRAYFDNLHKLGFEPAANAARTIDRYPFQWGFHVH